MDPYLDDPSVWPGLHLRLITESAAQLQEQLNARGYYAEVGERVWLSTPERHVYPDVVAMRLPHPPSERNLDAGTLVADAPVRVKRSEIEIHEPFLEIYDSHGNRLVTGIEIVSPTNKASGEGRQMFQRKQQELREAGVHLVEIDLLRVGPHVLDVPEWALRGAPRHEYLVNVVRRDGEDFEFYPIRLRDRLPRVGVPLKSGEPDAVLDLQAAFDAAYDRGPYRVRIGYAADPTPPLPEDAAAWADQLLREKGLRS